MSLASRKLPRCCPQVFWFKKVILNPTTPCAHLCMQRFAPNSLPRLHSALEPLKKRMEVSYERFAAFLTELKMDHRDGKCVSDRLTQFLGQRDSVFHNLASRCPKLGCVLRFLGQPCDEDKEWLEKPLTRSVGTEHDTTT